MEEIKYKGKFVTVKELTLNGVIWEKVFLQSGVQVFPLNKEGEIYLIEEKRPHEKRPTRLKFVTGLMDKEGEDPLETANRELQEEIGFRANKMIILNHKESSGTINNHFYQIIATELGPSKIPNPDGEDTILSIKSYKIAEIHSLLEKGHLPWDMGALAVIRIEKMLQNGSLIL